VECGACGMAAQVGVPCARPGSGFTAAFEAGPYPLETHPSLRDLIQTGKDSGSKESDKTR
jgi:hypothetical protein